MEEKVKIKTPDGIELAGVLHNPNSPDIVIAFHGFESTKDSPKYILMGKELESKGFAFLRFDFRGCGESPGDKNDIKGRVEDAKSAIGWAKKNFKRIFLVGSSFGGALAIIFSQSAKAVVALCPPFGNILDLDMESALKNSPPLLVIHGTKDEIVPFEHAKKIVSLSPKAQLLPVEGGDHRFTNPEHLNFVIRKTAEFLLEHRT